MNRIEVDEENEKKMKKKFNPPFYDPNRPLKTIRVEGNIHNGIAPFYDLNKPLKTIRVEGNIHNGIPPFYDPSRAVETVRVEENVDNGFPPFYDSNRPLERVRVGDYNSYFDNIPIENAPTPFYDSNRAVERVMVSESNNVQRNKNSHLVAIKPSNRDYNVKIKIEKSIMSQVYKTLKSRFGYTILEIANLIEIELESFRSALYRGNTIPEKAFKKLEEIYGIPIRHTRIVGKNKEIILLKNSDSAELIGIALGDGHISDKSTEMNISLNGVDDPEYLNYVINFLGKIFDISLEDITIDTYYDKKLSLIRFTKLTYLKALIGLGFTPGDKVKNQIDVPSWVFTDISFIKRCLKGLIDTDGTIHINKGYKCFRIVFRNASEPLVESFKRMCNILGISTGSVLHSDVFDKRYSKYYRSYYVNVSAKKDVRNFLNLVQPKKLEYRRKYYGTWLLILENSEIFKIIKKKIELKFPKKSDRKFSKEFSEFLYSIALEYDLKLTDSEFKRVIDNALHYVFCQYSKELGKSLTKLYKELGSRNIILEYLEFYDVFDPTPSPKAIIKFIIKFLKEEKGKEFNEWKKKYKSSSISIDELNGRIKYFPNHLRSFLIKEILNIYYSQKVKQESLIYTKILSNVNNAYLSFLAENKKYCNAYRLYLRELINLVVILTDMLIEDRVKADKFINQSYGFSFSPSTIADIKREVRNALIKIL